MLETLNRVAKELAAAGNRWWLIGGAAARLHGVEDGALTDVDIILSPHDARTVLANLDVAAVADGGTDLFRSQVFGRWTAPPLAIDFMGGMQVRTSQGWRSLEPATREPILVGGDLVYVPSRSEMIEILRLFGRPKDLTRAAMLSAAIARDCLPNEPG